MEILKSIVRQFFHLLLLGCCFIFVLQIFFQEGIEGERDIFTAVARVYDNMLQKESVQCNGLNFLENEITDDVPVLIYNSGARQAGTNLRFKSILTVRKPDGTVVNGEVEDDFAIYLVDIKSIGGVSVMEMLSTSEIENLEEVPASFIYDKETDRLYLYSSGVYLVQVKIYGSSGGQAMYEFRLPVETS